MAKPPSQVFYAPTSRSLVTWTPELIRSAEAQARTGNLRMAAELCEDLLGDDRIPGCLGTRIDGLLGLPVSFEPGVGRRRRGAVRALEAGEDWMAICTEADASEMLRWGILLGVGPGQNLWREGEYGDGAPRYRDGRLVPRIKPWHPRYLRRDQTTRRWLMRVETASNTSGIVHEVPVEHGDGTWVLHAPYGLEAPWQRGAWRGLARWWLIKTYAEEDWARHSEKGSLLAVEADDRATVEQRRAIAEDLAQMASDGVCVLPNGYKLQLLEVAANTREIYGAQIEMANAAIAALLLGHSNNAEVQGANTGATAGENIRHDIRRRDGESWSTTAHDGTLVHWGEVNFGSRDVAPWPSYPTAPPEDLTGEASRLNVLGDALGKLTAADQGVDVRALLERFKVPIRKDAPPPALRPAALPVTVPAEDSTDAP